MSAPPPGEFGRYHRQMLLAGFGPEGQRSLKASCAVLVGCGALGCAAADLLARAGVGSLTLIDRDVVEWTNLQRQTLFSEADARDGMPKSVAAANRIGLINSSIEVRPVVADVNPRSVERLCANADVVIDGTDNFETRYLLNDACVKHGRPLVYGGVVGTAGMTMTIHPATGIFPGTPCLRCVFPDPPAPGTAPTCDTAGVLGPMVSVVAAVQAAEAMKVLLGRPDLLRRGVTQWDLWHNQHRTLDLRDLDRAACHGGKGGLDGCICCEKRRFEFLEADAASTVSICGTDSVQVLPAGGGSGAIDLESLAARLRAHGDFAAGPYCVRGRLAEGSGLRLTVFGDARVLVHGTTDPATARTIYARYIGS